MENTNLKQSENADPVYRKFNDPEFRKTYIREYMQQKYSSIVTCESCGKQVKRFSMQKHVLSKSCRLHKFESMIMASVDI